MESSLYYANITQTNDLLGLNCITGYALNSNFYFNITQPITYK